MDLIHAIESVPVWLWLTLAAALVALDAFATSSVYFGCLGVSFFMVGLLDALEMPGDIQIAALIVVFPIVAWKAPRVLARFARTHDLLPDLDALQGQVGRVLDSGSSGSAIRAHFADHGDWQIRCKQNITLRQGDEVQVVERDGLVLIVERTEDVPS